VELVNAQRGYAANQEVVARAVAGELRLLYVAPERFAARGFVDAMRGARVGLFVVDEAHCVSQWGHDFRPDYFSLADAAREVGARSTIALTATATPLVADDIARRLALRSPARVTSGGWPRRWASPARCRRSSTRARVTPPSSWRARWPATCPSR
jgi:ATP-dependent DNA helicase RecQ